MVRPESSTREVRVEAVTVSAAPPAHHQTLRSRPVVGELRRSKALVIVVIFAAFAVAVLGTLIATAVPSGSARRAQPARPPQVRPAEKAAIASAFGYPYPVRCLTVTLSAGDPDYARAFIDRGNGCGRYHGYINASFHRVAGVWRLVLDEGQLYVPNSLLTPRAPPAG